MNKLTPVEYIEDTLSHHPKTILLWMTQGIVINGERYAIKEFRLKDDKLYAVISDNKYNPKYFEVQLCPDEGTLDEGTLKDIYKAIKDNKIAIYKEITDRENEINRVDNAIKENTAKIDEGITDHQNDINRVDKAIAANTTKINQEITDRTNEITRVDGAISTLNSSLSQKQNKLTSGEGITIQDNVISASGSGTVLDITLFTSEGFSAFLQLIKNGPTTIEIFTFDCQPQFTERELNANLKAHLKKFVRAGMTVSSGSLTITNDGTSMKLIKSGSSENVSRQETFTFH